MINAGIIGVGSYLPDNIVTNYDLEKKVDTTNDWIVTRTGIEERRIAVNETSSDLGYKSSLKALEDAQIKPEDLDMIIVSTLAPDMMFPSTACLIQAKLGAVNAAAFDVVGACTGFIFALSTAAQFIQTGLYKNILVTAAECCSAVVDWTDRNTCVLFGDGAGSVVVSSNVNENKFISFDLHSDGTLADILKIPAGGSATPASKETVENKQHFMIMDGPEVYKAAVKFMQKSSIDAIEKSGLKSEEIDCLIPHQANKRIIDSLKKRLNLSDDKVIVNLQKYGNTSSATIPIGLDEAVKTGKISKGDTVLITAAGGGFTYGSIIFKY